jgi:hypothetical protein
MYPVDSKDEVVKIADLPQSDVGSPSPTVLSNENRLLLAYGNLESLVDWDGIDNDFSPSFAQVTIVEFVGYRSYMFGSPNDEAFGGHPLASRALTSYAAFEIKQSSWIRQLEKMNRVHPHHDKKRFDSLRHFIFAFHDSTFECVALSYKLEVCELVENESTVELLAERILAE